MSVEVSQKSKKIKKIYNPATGECIREVVFATEAEITGAVQYAKKAFLTWSRISPLKRANILFRFKILLEKHIEELAALITEEHGKVLEDARGSIARGLEVVDFFCGIPQLLKGEYSENIASDMDCYTIKQPLGVCLGITPFNFPAMVPLWMAVPAIMCGNTFILKPSEQDPSAAILIAKLFEEAGLPEGVFQVIQGDKEAVNFLLESPDIQAVSFVGSSTVAKAVYQKAILHNKRAQAFGSAKNHALVMPDADIPQAAAAIAAAAFGSAGERCMALSVALVVGDTVADQLLSALRAEIDKIKVGPGDDPSSHIGPLINEAHRDRVKNYIELGVSEGANLLVDGRHCTIPKGYFLNPSLFDQVTAEMKIYQEEIFGPVLCVVRVQSFAEAMVLINQHAYGNGTCIFTQEGAVARLFAQTVQVGMVGINVPIPVPVAYHSFGGWKHSFYGDCGLHSTESVQFYTQRKSITQRWATSAALNSFNMPTHQ